MFSAQRTLRTFHSEIKFQRQAYLRSKQQSSIGRDTHILFYSSTILVKFMALVFIRS